MTPTQWNTSTLPPVGDFFLWVKLDTGEIIKVKRLRHIHHKEDAWPMKDVRGHGFTAKVVAWDYA